MLGGRAFIEIARGPEFDSLWAKVSDNKYIVPLGYLQQGELATFNEKVSKKPHSKQRAWPCGKERPAVIYTQEKT